MMTISQFVADGPNKMNYALAVPANRDITGLPLLIYLHGAGERGKTFENVYRHAIPKLIREGADIPAVVLFPQCPARFIWNNVVAELYDIITDVLERYSIERDRVVLTGSSMGGYGTWETAMCYPELFAAIAPVAGGGVMWRTERLKDVPVFAWHGEDDPVVYVSQSEIMVDLVNRFGGHAELFRLENMEHNDAIDFAYRNTDLIERLLSCRKKDFSPVPEPFVTE